MRWRLPGALLASGIAGPCSLACSPAGPDPEVSSEAPYFFRDVAEESGLAQFRQRNGSVEKPFIVETVGAGVAFLDHDQDGDMDVYLSNGGWLENRPSGEAGEARDALFVNEGGAFRDDTARAGLGHTGWTNGVRVADVQGDGWPDVYLTCYGANAFYQNADGGVFVDRTAELGVGDSRWSTASCFLDFDRDGDLDLYVANYVEFDQERMLSERPTVVYQGVEVMKGPRGLIPSFDALYRNDGSTAGAFSDVSEEMGVTEVRHFAFQCVPFDTDLDGWIDVYVANDSVPNVLWQNQAGERFEDVAFFRGVGMSQGGKEQAGMGVALGDCDGDLEPDLFVTNFSDDYFTLYRGTGDGYFVDVTQKLGLGAPTKSKLGWGCGFADFDSDGDVELFAVNGHVYPQVDRFELGTSYRQKNQLFERSSGTFRIPAGAGGPGFALEMASRGSALGDFDDDGDLDLLIGNIDDRPALLRNEGPSRSWIKILLIGAGKNRDAIGARLVARVGDRAQLFLVGAQDGFLSSSDPRIHVGLGEATKVDALEITWPDGRAEIVRDLAGGRQVVIEEDARDGSARISARSLQGGQED